MSEQVDKDIEYLEEIIQDIRDGGYDEAVKKLDSWKKELKSLRRLEGE